MIEEIVIRDLGVIGEARLQIGPGFTALTGETGAGKTMILTALGLLLGERADSASVRRGQDQAAVHGLWKLDPNSAVGKEVAERLAEADVDFDPSELIISRTVGSDGKSRATISARPVHHHKLLAEFGKKSSWHGTRADARSRLAIAAHGAADNQFRRVKIHVGFGQPACHGLSNCGAWIEVPKAVNLSLRLPLAHRAAVGTLAEQQAECGENHGFSGSGFAG